MFKISYISDLSLPSNRAQSVHIFKMIDALLSYTNKLEFFCQYCPNHYTVKKIKNDYSINNTKNFKISGVFKKNSLLYNRFFFGLKVALNIRKNKDQLVITRSFFASFFMVIFNINHFLEIHQALKGLTKILFINLNFINSKNIIKIIFISKGLSDHYSFKKTNNIILHDCYSPKDFKKNKLKKKIKNIYYIGSFYKGRGIEVIKKLSILSSSYNFFLYGKRNEKIKYFPKNVKIFSFQKYKSILKIIKKADVLLMPYQSKVSINAENYNDDISKFISPLKMFEYLGTGTPIISSGLKVLKEVLIHKKNAYLVTKHENPYSWKKALDDVSKDIRLRKRMYAQSLKTASMFTWDLRVKKIIFYYKNK